MVESSNVKVSIGTRFMTRQTLIRNIIYYIFLTTCKLGDRGDKKNSHAGDETPA
jgi:hypothetical protein